MCLCRTGIVARRYHSNFDTNLISGIHILKDVCCMMPTFPDIHFFLGQSHYFTGALGKVPQNGKDTVFFSQHLLQPSIITRGFLVESIKLEGYVYLRKTTVALPIFNQLISWCFLEKIKKYISWEFLCRL